MPEHPKIDHLKTLLELVVAGEKATDGPWERRLYQSGTVSVGTATKHSIHICHPVEMVPVPGNDGEFTGKCEDDKTADAEIRRLDNAAFIAQAANARPALAALLRVVDAAKVAHEAHATAIETEIRILSAPGIMSKVHAKELRRVFDTDKEAHDALDAALRDLAPEVEDGE